MRIVFIAVFFFVPSVGLTCSCIPTSGNYERYVLERLCAVDAVFVGDVESSIQVRDLGFEYKIWPRESFKGYPKSPAFALTEATNTCGYRFRVDGRYLIFARRYEDTEYVTASVCGLTQLLDTEGLVYKVLSESKGDIEQICSEEAIEERRLERLREKDVSFEQLDEETRQLLESGE